MATAHALNPGLLARLPFYSIRDFSPITLAVDTPLVFVVPASLPVANMRELIALAKSQPKRVIYGSSGQTGWFTIVDGLYQRSVTKA